MVKIYSIYKATNIINGKMYIGFDSNFPKRKFRHLYNLNEKNKGKVGYNDIFHKALRKYGKDNFIWEIIYQSKDKDHTLNVMEPFFIREYNTFINFENSNGYNMTLGGEGMFGFKHSVESKKKISIKSSLPKNIIPFFIQNLEGKTFEGNCIFSFCRENNLDVTKMKGVLEGKRISHKNYF